MQQSQAFQAALAIIATDPVPPNAERRLAELEARINPDEADKYPDIWEAYYAAGGTITPPEG